MEQFTSSEGQERGQAAATPPALIWPQKYDLLGVQVSATDYEGAITGIVRAVDEQASAVVTFQAVHPIVVASSDESFRAKVNSFEMLCPDGQPVRWAVNWLHGTGLKDRVYGPELTVRLCKVAAESEIKVFFYGSTDKVLEQLKKKLLEQYPEIQIVGTYSPPFRALSPEEDEEVVHRINASGAQIVFIGLGAPKQDEFGFEHRNRIHGVQVCVGAAFDFIAETKSVAPSWMQRNGLEWLYRLTQEPKRLWRRYLVTNSLFVLKVGFALLRKITVGRPSSLPAPPKESAQKSREDDSVAELVESAL